MFTSRSVLISLVAAATCLAIPAQAADSVFTAAMDGAQCLPDAIQTPATGTVELRVSADGKKIDYKITLNKLSNPSQADLHVGAASQNGQAVVKLWPLGSAAARRGEVTGVLAEGSVEAAKLTGSLSGLTVGDLIALIEAGDAYVSVGNTSHPVDAIRGQIK